MYPKNKIILLLLGGLVVMGILAELARRQVPDSTAGQDVPLQYTNAPASHLVLRRSEKFGISFGVPSTLVSYYDSEQGAITSPVIVDEDEKRVAVYAKGQVPTFGHAILIFPAPFSEEGLKPRVQEVFSLMGMPHVIGYEPEGPGIGEDISQYVSINGDEHGRPDGPMFTFFVKRDARCKRAVLVPRGHDHALIAEQGNTVEIFDETILKSINLCP